MIRLSHLLTVHVVKILASDARHTVFTFLDLGVYRCILYCHVVYKVCRIDRLERQSALTVSIEEIVIN